MSQRFSQLKGDKEQCLVNLTDNLAIPLKKLTGKAGRPPGCRVRDNVHATHLVSDIGLVAHAVVMVHAVPLATETGLVAPGKAGVIATGKVHAALSALALAQVSTGAHPMSF
jgi:hypothetical protein